MSTLLVFDPSMCCSTGVCGPDADDALMEFSTTLRCWLERHGVTVQRMSPTSNPEAFMDNPVVYNALMNTASSSIA